MEKQRILIIEDDKHISKLVKYNLEKAGYDATVTVTGEEAFEVLDKEQVDLIILDIMLPKMDGFEVCRSIKQESKFKNIPVVMLTAKGEEVDRIVGLELGADDYIVKPFSPRELVLRVKAVLKRGHGGEENEGTITAGNIRIDLERSVVISNGKPLKLTATEFKLLVELIKAKGKVLSRDALLDNVRGTDYYVTDRTIDTHIRRLREKLGKSAKHIETVRGFGYKFMEDG